MNKNSNNENGTKVNGQPKVDKPKVAKIKAVQLKADKPKVAKIKAVQLKADKPKVVKVKAVQLKADKPKVAKIKAVQLKADKPKVAKIKAVQLKADKPKVAKIKADKLNTDKSEVAKVNTAQLDTDKLEVEQVNTAQLKSDKSEVVKVNADLFNTDKPKVVKSKRTQLPILFRTQLISIILILIAVVPLFIITPNGNTALRFNIPTAELYVFNQVIKMDDFFITSILILLFMFLLIMFTQVFGKIWCAILCPQSIFLNIIMKLETRLSFLGERFPRYYLSFLGAFLLTLVFFFFFTSPYLFFDVFIGKSSHILTPMFIGVMLFLFIDFAFFRYKWCKYVCPYSKIQSVMSDDETLFIGMMKDGDEDCIHCNACVRVCPVDIDPRKTPNAACFYCEKCIVACDKALSKKGKRSILKYNWGTGFKFNLFRPNIIITGIISLAFFIYLIYLVWFNIPVSFTSDFRVLERDNSSYVLGIKYKNRRDSALLVNLKTDNNNIEISPDSTILRAGEKIKKEYIITVNDNGSINDNKDIKIFIETDSGYKKEIELN